MPTCGVMNKQGKKRDYLRRMQITGLSTRTDGQTNIRFHTKKHKHMYSLCGSKKHHFLASFESLSKLDKFNRCKNKDADGEDSTPPPPSSPSTPAPLPPFPPVLLPWLADWLATVRILNERPFLSSQSGSQSVT